jgi:hypothetical protein
LQQRIKSDRPLSLMGFSLGSRVVTGALHLSEGGTLLGQRLPPTASSSIEPTYRVTLVAPAIDRAWLQPHQRHGLAMNHVVQLINLYNSNDPVLKRFRFIDASSRPVAAGFAGFVGLPVNRDLRLSGPLTGQERIKQFDCSKSLGNTHDERSYFNKCPCVIVAIDNLLWKD